MRLIRTNLVNGIMIPLLFLSGVSAADAGGTVADAKATDSIPAGHYRLDKYHSTITFRVSHLGFSYYTASFQEFDASLEFDPRAPQKSTLEASIEVSSLTLPAAPDGFVSELLSANWLNASDHPEMSYRSKDIVMTGANTGRMTGDFTFNGRTAPVDFEVRFNGGYPGFPEHDPQARVGFSATGNLKRSDFGITAGIPEPGSTMGVGDEVAITIETEFSGPKLAPPKP